MRIRHETAKRGITSPSTAISSVNPPTLTIHIYYNATYIDNPHLLYQRSLRFRCIQHLSPRVLASKSFDHTKTQLTMLQKPALEVSPWPYIIIRARGTVYQY